MTTIHISTMTRRNSGKYQVFGAYDGDDDRYTFAVKSLDTLAEAEAYAARLCEIYQPDMIERN